MLLYKQYYDFYSQASPLSKKYVDLCFSPSLHRLIADPTRTAKRAKTFIDHILTNSTEKVIQIGVIEMGLPDHELIYCTRKTSPLKLNEHYEISIRSMKNYSDHDKSYSDTTFYPHLMLLAYLLATNVLSVYRSLEKLKNEGSTMIRISAVQKLEERCFSVKI